MLKVLTQKKVDIISRDPNANVNQINQLINIILNSDYVVGTCSNSIDKEYWEQVIIDTEIELNNMVTQCISS